MQRHYNEHKGSQRPHGSLDKTVLKDLHDPAKFCEYLADEKHYWNYLIYFQEEIDKKGFPSVINEYLFGGDERAKAMLIRMFGGKQILLFLLLCLTDIHRFSASFNSSGFRCRVSTACHHRRSPCTSSRCKSEVPILSFSCYRLAPSCKAFSPNIQSPEISKRYLPNAFVATSDTNQGIVQHSGWIGDFFLSAEKAAASNDNSKSLVDLLDEIHADKKLSTAAGWDDSNKIRDGILVRAPEEMIGYASQFKVRENELEVKTAEMINAASKCITLTTSQSQIAKEYG